MTRDLLLDEGLPQCVVKRVLVDGVVDEPYRKQV